MISRPLRVSQTIVAAVVGFFVFAWPGVSIAATKTFIENFTTRTYQGNGNSTTWDIVNHQARLSRSFGSYNLDVTAYFPKGIFSASNGSGYAILTGGDNKIARFDGHTITPLNLPSKITGINPWAIGYFQKNWYIGPNDARKIIRFNGKTFTTLTIPDETDMLGSINWIIPGQSEMIVIDGYGRPFSYKNGVWYNLGVSEQNPNGLPASVVLGNGAWNAARNQWLFTIANDPNFYTYSSSDGWQYITSPAAGAKWKTIATNGKQWAIGGGTGDEATTRAFYIYLYDGTSFKNASPTTTGFGTKASYSAYINNLAWDGREWIGMIQTYSTEKLIIRVNAAGTTKTRAYLTGPEAWYYFYMSSNLPRSSLALFSGFTWIDEVADHKLFVIGDLYNKAYTLQSKVITTTRKFNRATLKTNQDTPPETSIVYQLSNDGGQTWVTVKRGKTARFTSSGTKLMWRANLQTNNPGYTPKITRIEISY